MDARIKAWRRVDQFDEIRAAVDDALQWFPDPQAVALVVGAVRHINSSNVKWDAKPAGLDAWNAGVALRALASLPRPPRLYDHSTLVRGGVIAKWLAPWSAGNADGEHDVREDLTLLARFLRRLLDDEDRLWSPLPLDRRLLHYPPVRRTDPRWHWDTPTDEEGFLAYEEAWYAHRLRANDLSALHHVRQSWVLPEIVSAFATRFPAGSPAEAAYRERMPADVPEFPWLPLLDAVRRTRPTIPMRSASGVSFWVTAKRSSGPPTSGQVGHDLAVDVFVMNRTDATIVIPLGRVRAAVVHGEGPRDDDALPPPRTAVTTDLEIVAPNHTASVPLSLPMLRDGLARVVVALDNDAVKIGDADGVWTGAERYVLYVDIPRYGIDSRPALLRSAHESADHPERVDGILAEIAAMAREEPDDRGAEACGEIAVAAKDGRVAASALAAVESALARGCGANTYGSLVTIATDRERPRDLRLRAVDGLAHFATGRTPARFVAGPQVHVVSDVPVPPRVRAHVRERLTALASDVDVLVAERAQAALAR
ncbi:MAG TPA: hypothetical protein VND21_04215 [Planctomycetota bacterium]|nr:hypothetical protein [Planctomycetota bacterium]